MTLSTNADKYGVREGLVYLELQNLSQGDTLYVYYNVRNSPLKCELRDPAGRNMQNFPGPVSDWMPSACWLSLPHDSTLRFPTGNSSFTPNSPCLFVVSAFKGGKWVIPMTATNDYYLSGTFSSMSPTNEIKSRVWEGTLKLPAVKISVKNSQ